MRLDRVRAVLLDMGGVLVPELRTYSGAARDTSLRAALRSLGVVDPERLIVESGERLRDAYRALATECTQPDPDLVLAELPADVRGLLLNAFRHEETTPPYSFVRDTVATLARRYALGLASNTIVPGNHHVQALDRAGILSHFGCAVWSANFGRRKPDPAMILYVLLRLEVPPRNAVFVGDKLRTDAHAARRAGVRSVWIRKQARVAEQDIQPDFVLRDLRELPLLLARLD